jgi:hypothetical protein
MQPRMNPEFNSLAPLPMGDHLVAVRRRTAMGGSVVVERVVQVEQLIEQTINPIQSLDRQIKSQQKQG